MLSRGIDVFIVSSIAGLFPCHHQLQCQSPYLQGSDDLGKDNGYSTMIGTLPVSMKYNDV